MRFGYAFWGFLGDNKLDSSGNELSTPDGNATYSWSIIHEVQKRGGLVYLMQEDRDFPAYKRFHRDNFLAFSTQKRYDAYMDCRLMDQSYPVLDYLLIEWRWPIDGRNCDITGNMATFVPEKHSSDLLRQLDLIKHYKESKTKIIFWDLDHKLRVEDEKQFLPDAIFETSSKPLELHLKRTRVEPPICTDDLLQMNLVAPDPTRKLVYIGSRYERDDVIDQYIKPVSDRFPGQVEFWGKWDGDCKERWPNISFHGRITVKDFYKVYSSAVACPLLAKRSYLESGFITPRPWEALMFGTLPVGLCELTDISSYTDIVIADATELGDVVEELSTISLARKHELREHAVEKLRFMDVKHFVDEIERVK